MENIRQFKITFYLDTTKRTEEKIFNIFELDEAEALIRKINNEGALNAL